MNSGHIEKGGQIVLVNGKKIVRAWALESRQLGPGESSALRVGITPQKDGPFSGLFGLDVNLNHWKVYRNEDPELTEVLLNGFLPLEEH